MCRGQDDDLPSGAAMLDRVVHEVGDRIKDQIAIAGHQYLRIADNRTNPLGGLRRYRRWRLLDTQRRPTHVSSSYLARAIDVQRARSFRADEHVAIAIP